VSAIDDMAAEIRRRVPPTPDLRQRIARRSRYARDVEPATDSEVARHYLLRAAGIAGSFLDRLNDDELELRLAYDRAAHEEWDVGEDDDGAPYRRRRVSSEVLGWTEAEVARRKAWRESPPPPRVTKEVW